MAKTAIKQVKKSIASAKKSTSAKKAVKATKKTVAAKPVRKPLALEPLTHCLDTLLHTMRCIAQHEDELCTLLHDARRNGKVSAPLLRELQAVLDELPAEEYTDDLQAIRALTGAA